MVPWPGKESKKAHARQFGARDALIDPTRWGNTMGAEWRKYLRTEIGCARYLSGVKAGSASFCREKKRRAVHVDLLKRC